MKHQISLGRRMLALLIDWLMSYAIALGFFSTGSTFLERSQGARVWTLAIFFCEVSFFTAFGGASAGHRVMKMKVVRFSDGSPPNLGEAILRTLLICLVITAITFDENGRGIHERLSNTKLANAF